MSSYNYSSDQPSAPPLYPDGAAEYLRPVPPTRSDRPHSSHDESLLPPKVPQRMDVPPKKTRPMSRRSLDDAVDAGIRRVEEADRESTCNYNAYATKKTVAHGFLLFALIASNAMQLRTLILQKQHDTVWIVSLLLVCLTVILEIGFGVVLFILAKNDIRDSRLQIKLERFNCIGLILTIVISVLNVVINGLMLSTNPNAFLDRTTLAMIENRHSS